MITVATTPPIIPFVPRKKYITRTQVKDSIDTMASHINYIFTVFLEKVKLKSLDSRREV